MAYEVFNFNLMFASSVRLQGLDVDVRFLLAPKEISTKIIHFIILAKNLHRMDPRNQTIITEFVLFGFTMNMTINIVLFILFSVIYIVTTVGNSLIICMVIINPKLHRPMYVFLCMLSILDLCYSSTVLPRLLTDLLSTKRTISRFACAIQIYVILFVEGSECQLLAVMAYDRYIAICRPLHYSISMRWSICYRLVSCVFIASFMLCVFPSLFSPLTICYNQINHFMCEMLAIIKLSCENISASEHIVFSISFITLLLPLMFILLSYASIISSILKMRSTRRSKAFSTCTSHLAVVALYFGTVMLMYFGPSSMYSTDQEKYSSIFYVIVSPMLNPLIYSLNNREVKESFNRFLSKFT
ncbi:olfactory receptor 5AR1-like [Dendropsophus ebraccatus]|uniref:olfactory receptor 5AR1-like n=1 Tax=Dendropsophus ebraccatus TaxID=150705 RepID=UPI003831F0A9